MGLNRRTETALDALDEITDPCSEALGYNLGLVSMGLIDEDCITVGDGRVEVKLRLTSPSCEMVHYFSSEINRKLEELDFEEVEIDYDYGLEWHSDLMTDEAKRKMEDARI